MKYVPIDTRRPATMRARLRICSAVKLAKSAGAEALSGSQPSSVSVKLALMFCVDIAVAKLPSSTG